ncbi:MAG: hypothetical protein GX576_06220 [Thauera phenolivorans]|uniref:Uncharacterized protein n=1 Tax=Thauera phenolivorans TaxID=1792543 RepID=A0A7X7R7W4_9RHOO|nr:hypothetical protein [Thauera phenolivorans]NLF53981.1 hypothetical protein [Thauera phenolivorans]
MTRLSAINEAALRVLGRMPGARMRALRAALGTVCERHWSTMRGARPQTRFAQALWDTPPPLSALFIHLYAVGDPALDELLERLHADQALALIALGALEDGDAEGARSAYEAMKLFGAPASRATLVEAALAPPPPVPTSDAALRHAHRPALWRAVAGAALHAGRWDTPGVLAALHVVAAAQGAASQAEADLQPLLELLAELHVRLLGVEDGELHYSLRGEPQPPLPRRRLAEMLAEAKPGV